MTFSSSSAGESPQHNASAAAGLIQNPADLVAALRATNTSPLWAQMQKLNPPAPNPQTIPHVWNYDEIRPYLVKAGELITEKQAERRVLMLGNPARGTVLFNCPFLIQIINIQVQRRLIPQTPCMLAFN